MLIQSHAFANNLAIEDQITITSAYTSLIEKRLIKAQLFVVLEPKDFRANLVSLCTSKILSGMGCKTDSLAELNNYLKGLYDAMMLKETIAAQAIPCNKG